MDSELSDLAAVKAINQGLTTTSNVLFNHITASSNISASGTITTSGIVSKGNIHLGANDIQITQILSNGSTTRDLIGYDTTDTAVVGNPSTNKVKLVGDVTASGNISSSGTITMLTASIGGGTFTSTSLASAIAGGGGGVDTTGTPADNQIAVFTDADTIEGTSKLTFSNNDLLIHSSNADNSGIEIYGGVVAAAHPYISPVGSQTTIQFGDGDTGHILDLRRNKIGFDSDSTNTYIQADSDDPENLEIHADNNIELKADNLVTMDSASIEHRLFDTGSTHLGANGAVGDIVKFGGTTTVAGGLYYLKSDGTWGLAKADAVGTATSSLAVAVGTDSTTDGMCLRGFVNPFTDPGAGTGNPVYLSDTSQGRFQATAPDSNNDVVRILGYQYGTDLIYFNPSNDFIVITA